MKRFISLFMTVIMIFSVVISTDMLSVSATDNSNIKWSFNSKTGTLTISGAGKMDDYNEHDIKAPWKKYNNYMTNIIIENGITSIGNYAFWCSETFNITIPNSVKNIGKGAFAYCKNLTNVTIPNGVTSINYDTFDFCSSLTNITIPNSVTSIDNYAFSYCYSLKNITIPNSVTSIGWNTFERCSSLTNITIPNSVTSIGNSAFSGCTSLTNITIPNSVTSLGNSAFSGCTSLTNITIPNSVTLIGEYVFRGCTSLTNVAIPNSVTLIDNYAFSYCYSLKNITIPNSVTSIGWHTFEHCSSLTNITIPNSVTFIDNYAFSGCSNLKDIYYEGTKSQWEKLDINLDENITIHYGKKDDTSSDKPTQKAKFTLGKNNNSYYHSDENISKAGFKGVKDYSLDKSYYNKLVKGRSNSEIKYLQKNMKNSWSGSCFGIASTMGLLYNKNINSKDISSSANKNYYQLPLPYKDKKFLNNIQYYYMIQNIGYSRSRSLAVTSSYCMGWVLRGLNYFNNWIKDDSEEDCLKTIVEKVKNTSSDYKTYMFTFSTKEGYSHAVLITDIEYSEDNKEYTLTIFDENSVTPKYPNGMYGTLKIADNYKSFIYDCDGVKFDNENYTNIQLFDLDEVKKAANKPELYAVNDHNRSNSTIRMALNKDMKITNESGKYIQIKDGKIDTNTEINSLYSYTIGNQGMISIDIKGSNFKVSDLDKKCNVSISNDKTFMSLEGNNIKSANLSLNNKKITCSGNGNDKYNFDATCSTDSIVNSSTKETGMLEVKGTAKGNTTTTVNNNKLTTTSDSLENAVGSNYIDNTVTKENLTKNKVIKKATVIVRKSINKCKTNKLKTVTYNGKIIKPSVTVKYENRKLVVNKDYKISYSNNKNAGKGKITISGINNYVGTKTLYFSINKAKPTVKFAKPSVTIKKSKKTYVNKLKKKTDGKIVYSSSNKKIAVVNSKGKVTFKRKGKVKIYAQTVKSKNYYNTKTYYVLKIK